MSHVIATATLSGVYYYEPTWEFSFADGSYIAQKVDEYGEASGKPSHYKTFRSIEEMQSCLAFFEKKGFDLRWSN